MHSATKLAQMHPPTLLDVSHANFLPLLHPQKQQGCIPITTNLTVSGADVPKKQHAPRPPVKRALLIGVNGINHKKGPRALNFCCRDAGHLKACLKKHYGYSDDDITMMLDSSSDTDPKSNPTYYPSKENILSQIEKFTGEVHPGDQLVFYYSGHGMQFEDSKDKTEEDGKDEAISTAEGDDILDDILYEKLVEPLVPGCRLTAIIDSCFSGTMLDLPHRRCNRSWFPWVARGVRRTQPFHQHVVRQNGVVFPVGPLKKRSSSLHICTFKDGGDYHHRVEDTFDAPADIAKGEQRNQSTGPKFISDGPSSFVAEPSSLSLTPEFSSCPEDDVPTADSDTTTLACRPTIGGHIRAAAFIPSLILGDEHATICQSPTTTICSGWEYDCRPIEAEEQTAICISASREGQRAIEDVRNEQTMTSILLKQIEDDMSSPHSKRKSLRDLVKLVSHEIYKINYTAYKELLEHRCKRRRKTLRRNSRRRGTMFEMGDSKLAGLDEELGQDIEISSKGPLNSIMDQPLNL